MIGPGFKRDRDPHTLGKICIKSKTGSEIMRYWVLIPAIFIFILSITGCWIGSKSDREVIRDMISDEDVSEESPAEPDAMLEGTGAARLQYSNGASSGLSALGYINGGGGGGEYYPAGGSAQPNAEPYDLTFFENYGVNPFISTEDEKTSTFGMDVDTASYTVTRRYIMDGNMPDPDSIRTEEFINYFDQNYEEPSGNNIFGITLEGAESIFGRPNYHLLKIGIKAMDVSKEDRPAANMVFVIDVSGSMNRENRLELVKKSLRRLAGELKEGDRIGLVIYGSTGQVISDLTSNHDSILASIDRLVSGGSTNAEQGLRLAYDMARDNFEDGKINRIILCSDGVANVGNTDADVILEQIKADAQSGITLTCMGFGMGNYNDVMMEKLANHGDGLYYYIDTDSEAERLFRDGATQMLHVLGSDAKVQVVFNEDVVDRFRLLGYENRHLNEEDFEDDSVDAGEVGAGQSVTALYEIRIRDDYQDQMRDEVATVKIRYMNFETGEIETDEETAWVRTMMQDFDDASHSFQFTAGVAEFAELLKSSYWAQESSFGDVLDAVENLAANDDETQFVELVNQCVSIEDS